MEVEYRGTVQAATKVVWICQFLREPSLPILTLTTIYYDKKLSIQVVDNPISCINMKHVELHAHYLRQLGHENVVSLEYCITNDQVVDIFTKPLTKARFIKIHMMLWIHEATIMGGL
jgi:hypothetical protein